MARRCERGFDREHRLDPARPVICHVFTDEPVLLIGVVVIMIIPIPAFLLDILLASNIALSLIILFVALYLVSLGTSEYLDPRARIQRVGAR